MHLAFPCPRCEQPVRREVAAEQELACSGCGWARPVASEDLHEGSPRRCLACGCQDLWRQKDFPQALGLAMVAAGAVSFLVAMAYYRPVLGIAILLAFAAIDLVLYVVMKDVLVCYRCQARHQNVPNLEQTPYFQLDTFERYRQESARLEQAKSGRG